MKTRAELALMVPDGGVFLELGVAAGRFADQVLSTNTKIKYVGIDRWADHHDEAEMMGALATIKAHGNHHRVHRMTFDEALPLFQPLFFDAIYIDGYAHTGQEGGKTLADWWPKLKHGGVFCGHDYDPAHYPQTVIAVDSFVDQMGIADDLRFIQDEPHPSWWVIKK